MSEGKFRSLLEKKALYFCRLDCLPDRFEGSYPRRNYEQPPVDYESWPNELAALHKLAILADRREETKANRKRLYVNCWQRSEYESQAMWHERKIAVQSTVLRVQRALQKAGGHQYMGNVVYKDFEKDIIWVPPQEAPFWPALLKRPEYEFEKEMRVLVLEDEVEGHYARNGAQGVFVQCDLAVLVYRVVTAPDADLAIVRDAERWVKDAGLDVPVDRSELDAMPYYECEPFV